MSPKGKKKSPNQDSIPAVKEPTLNPKLERAEVMELNWLLTRVDMQSTVLENLKMKEEILNTKYIRERDTVRLKQRDTVASMEAVKAEYNAARIKIEERLGISLDNYLLREDGELIKVDAEGNPLSYVGPPME